MNKEYLKYIFALICFWHSSYAQIPDSLIIQNDSINKQLIKLGVTFGTSVDFIDINPDSFTYFHRLGYYAGADILFNISPKSVLNISTGVRFVRTKVKHISQHPRYYGVLSSSIHTEVSYEYGLIPKLSLNLGTGADINLEVLQPPYPSTKKAELDHTTYYTLHFGVVSQKKIGRTLILPELRYTWGINTIKNYSIFESVHLHFISLLIHFSNV